MCLHKVWQHNNRLVAIRYSRVSFEIPTRHLHLIAYFVSLRKWLWNYEGLITLCGITLFEWIVLPWLPICQGKDSGLSPRYAPPWCMTMRGSDHAPPPSWAECLTALSNKLHSRQLAEISWKGELTLRRKIFKMKHKKVRAPINLTCHCRRQLYSTSVYNDTKP